MITDDMLYFENMYQNNCHFVVLGDFNARVAERPDFVENEYLYRFAMMPDDYIQDEYMYRKSQDKTVNENGKLLLEFCKATGLRILNGRIGWIRMLGNIHVLIVLEVV